VGHAWTNVAAKPHSPGSLPALAQSSAFGYDGPAMEPPGHTPGIPLADRFLTAPVGAP
jgi:hypothetical protein